MLLVTQGWGLLSSQYFQTSCSPLLPPVLPFTVCMFLSRQVTLKTSSQNMYWEKRMVESPFFNLSVLQQLHKVSRNRQDRSLVILWPVIAFNRQAWQASHCAIHPLKPPDSTVGKSLIFPGIFFPSTGSLAWLPEQHQTQGQAGVPDWTGAHSPWTFLLKHLCLCYFFYYRG